LTSRFKVKRRDGLLLAVFYAVVGALQIIILAFSSSTSIPPHVGALAILSFIAAYGLFKTKRWSTWLVIALFFPQLVFGVVSLYASIALYSLFPEVGVLLLNIALAMFIALSFISFIYVAVKRKTFE